ncbi:MAG: cupin domain-containing protein [Acidobacteria bacterium]|nr:cupin domain-containing protein [Acidobacteriota bacterium]
MTPSRHDLDHLDDVQKDLAALHALGALDPEEEASFQEHLALCDACRAEVGGVEAALRDLPLAAPEVAPPASLRARVVERIQQAKQSDVVFALARDAVWTPTGIDGIETRRLFHDEADDRMTMLVRMAAGTTYPGHRHTEDEDCYVIEGDLTLNEVKLKGGDYVRANAGSLHRIVSTEKGCLLLIVASAHDELIGDGPAA